MSWYSSSWPYRKKITVNGLISGNHTNFPFLFKVNTPDTDLAAHALTTGKDFVVTTSDETTRTHCEIENWSAGSGCVWIRAPTLTNNTSTDFYLYYGKGTDCTADAGYKPSGTWDHTNFVVVYHLNEKTGFIANDSLSYGRGAGNEISGACSGGVTRNVNGISDGGDRFDGVNDIIFIKDNAIFDITNGVFSLWFSPSSNFTTGSEIDPLIGQLPATTTAGDWILRLSTGGYLYYGIKNAANAWKLISGSSITFTKDQWYHVVGLFGTGGMCLYVDGSKQTKTDASTDGINGTGVLEIGATVSDGTGSDRNFFMGRIDEVILSKTRWTPGWIKTYYSSLAFPSQFLTLGAEEAYPVPIIPVTWTDGNGLKIYVSCNKYPNHWIQSWCKRWDEDNWGITVETFLGSGARNFLFKNVTPGAVRELYNILGTPKFIDTTYESGNTLILEPQYGYGLSGIRQRRMIAVKNISDTFINPDYFNVKIEGYRLDIT